MTGATAANPARRYFYGWIVLAALWGVVFLNLGFPAYAPAVLNASMAKALALKRESLGDIFLVYMVMSGLPGPLVAMAIDRFGVRKTLVVGSLFHVAGALAMATVVSSASGAMLGYGLLTGAGVATGAVFTSQAGVARWFVLRRSLALSILYSAGAIGGLIAAPLSNWLIDATGSWRAGWWLIAALAALAAIIVVALVQERPEDLGQHPDGLAQQPDTHQGSGVRPPFVSPRQWAFGEAMRQPVYWVLLLTLLGSSAGYTLFIAHGVVHLQDLGHPASVGAWAVGVLAASGLIAKLILALLGDRIDPRRIFAAYTAVFGVGLVLIVDARALWQVLCAATCLGIGFGGGYVSLMATLSNYFGVRVFASLAGIAVAVNTTLSAVAPKVGGHLYDQGIGYAGTFYVIAAWCALGAVASFLVGMPDER